MNHRVQLAARSSLSFLWIFSGITSYIFAIDIGYEVLARGNVTGSLADKSILLGSVLDVFIGIWLLSSWRLRECCILQIVVITAYTILLTIIAPDFWLHSFGPLTKNFPILVLVYYLYRHE